MANAGHVASDSIISGGQLMVGSVKGLDSKSSFAAQNSMKKSVYSAFASKPMNIDDLNTTNELIAAHEILSKQVQSLHVVGDQMSVSSGQKQHE
jgi:hypothetical protein